jgi:hypothetical protein
MQPTAKIAVNTAEYREFCSAQSGSLRLYPSVSTSVKRAGFSHGERWQKKKTGPERAAFASKVENGFECFL